ncbi:hypothetical protein O6B42_07050 [Campylobacter ureolyticus]|uniref:hypothetical protein n=1 Tax=Campylobacter ureolyticus TaxID=827 RepID=UPI0022B50ACF|nr:hypothetical protein [Campylobacter ureolyticus]MCZ6133627.1 hypothetical protein [Campylobacter ureolyticus]
MQNTDNKKIKELEKRLKQVKQNYFNILDEIEQANNEIKAKFINYELLSFKECNQVANFKFISKNIKNLQNLYYSFAKGLINELEIYKLDDLINEINAQNSNIYKLYNQTIKELDKLINSYFIEAYETKLKNLKVKV